MGIFETVKRSGRFLLRADAAVFSDAARDRLEKYLARDGYEIPAGVGTRHAACSLAAINLALSGRMHDDVPRCMSRVIGRWIIGTQDRMLPQMRNSRRWRELLPEAAGTGRDPAHEKARLDLVLDWMWGTILPSLQSLADRHECGTEWRAMCAERSPEAINTAQLAAERKSTEPNPTWWHDIGTDHPGLERALYEADGLAISANWAGRAALEALRADVVTSSGAVDEFAAEESVRAVKSVVVLATQHSQAFTSLWAEWRAFDPVGLLSRLCAEGSSPNEPEPVRPPEHSMDTDRPHAHISSFLRDHARPSIVSNRRCSQRASRDMTPKSSARQDALDVRA